MSAYHTFTTARTTTPDRVAMVANLKTALADQSAVLAPVGDAWRGKKDTAWTAPQIATAQTILDTAPELTPQVIAQRTSRNKDVLATCALVVRARNITAWNGMTVQEKKTAAFAEADAWVAIRNFIEDNL